MNFLVNIQQLLHGLLREYLLPCAMNALYFPAFIYRAKIVALCIAVQSVRRNNSLIIGISPAHN